MSHTIPKQPTFQHRIEGESVTGIVGIDDFVSLEKIETILGVLRDYSRSVVPEANRHHFSILLDLAKDEVLDIKTRLAFQKTQKNQQLN